MVGYYLSVSGSLFHYRGAAYSKDLFLQCFLPGGGTASSLLSAEGKLILDDNVLISLPDK